MPLLNPVTNDKGESGIRFDFHKGQLDAWNSGKRIVAIISGGRSGKTSFGPLWLHREMQIRGPGDYLIAAPNFPLLDMAAIPEMQSWFERTLQLGVMRRGKSADFIVSDAGAKHLWPKQRIDRPSRVLFRHADSPEALEAMSAKAAWLDEAGQARFKQGSWEAVQQRLSFDQGRCLITTKPYNLGWLKRLIYDPWAANHNHPDIDVFCFDSLMNPGFPREEYERAKATLPAWRFNMMYKGLFSRPAGVIYEAFDTTKHVVKRFHPPASWPRFIGVDFGAVNTAAVYLAGELAHDGKPTGRYFVYRTYHPARRSEVKLSPAKHVEAILSGESGVPLAIGGSKSEDEARADFGAAGLYVQEPPIKDVEVGIDRVHAMLQQGNLFVFSDLADLIDEFSTYSRELNEQGEPTEKIEAKETFHLLDCARYACSHLYHGPTDGWESLDKRRGNVIERGQAAGVFTGGQAQAVDPYAPERDEWDDRDAGEPEVMRRGF